MIRSKPYAGNESRSSSPNDNLDLREEGLDEVFGPRNKASGGELLMT